MDTGGQRDTGEYWWTLIETGGQLVDTDAQVDTDGHW